MTQLTGFVDRFIKLAMGRAIRQCTRPMKERVIGGAKQVRVSGNACMKVVSCLLVSVVGVATLMHGCAPRQGEMPVGMSQAGEVPLDRKEVAGKNPEIWQHFGRIDHLSVLTSTFRSQGHGTGSWQGQLRANERGAEALATVTVRTGKFPRGTMFVQGHTTNPANGTDSARESGGEGGNEAAMDVWFVMEKREEGYFSQGGDWYYGVVTPDGVLQHQGKLESCARCHGQAETDYVFVPSEAVKAQQ